MAYVALSRVRSLCGLYLSVFDSKSVMVSPKCIGEINRLRKAFRSDLPLYAMPLERTKTKHKLTATSQHDEPKPKKCKYEPQSLLRPHKIKRKRTCTGEDEAPAKRVHCDQDCVFLLQEPSPYKFNPVDEVWQRSVSAMLGLQFVRKNKVRPGGPNVH